MSRIVDFVKEFSSSFSGILVKDVPLVLPVSSRNATGFNHSRTCQMSILDEYGHRNSQCTVERPVEMINSELRLFVGGLDYRSSKETVLDYFNQFGEVESMSLPRDPMSTQSRGYCFVSYKDAISVEKVLATKPHVIDNRRVEVRLAYGKATDKTKNRVFIGGIRDSHTQEDLQLFFSQFGNVVDVEIFIDRNTGKCRGFAFVLFEEPTVVQEVLAQRIFNIGGYSCEAKPAITSYRDREYRERRVRFSRNQVDVPFEKEGYEVPFTYFQNTPPPYLLQQQHYGDASLPYCIPVSQSPMLLPPFQYLDLPDQALAAPVIYQEFPDGISYESLYYAYTTSS